LVKFSGTDDSPATRRWRDLLVCESVALETLRAFTVPAANARWLDVQGRRFLEVERYDRVGIRGRKALLSLASIDAEYVGDGGSWTRMANRLVAAQLLDASDALQVRWLDVFGQLIANTDRHSGNLSFFVDEKGRFHFAPAYDMLPMLLAPVQMEVIDRSLDLAPPTIDTANVWAAAARAAGSYWERLTGNANLSDEMHTIARRFGEVVRRAVEKYSERLRTV
jgi:hypothetical protein